MRAAVLFISACPKRVPIEIADGIVCHVPISLYAVGYEGVILSTQERISVLQSSVLDIEMLVNVWTDSPPAGNITLALMASDRLPLCVWEHYMDKQTARLHMKTSGSISIGSGLVFDLYNDLGVKLLMNFALIIRNATSFEYRDELSSHVPHK